ncbi:MAG: hypothetical protein JNL10_12765, partial [Verrucomicrobiales bacterium]|nr:hypothetical protein [Verrucomicrobiales bacterium]
MNPRILTLALVCLVAGAAGGWMAARNPAAPSSPAATTASHPAPAATDAATPRRSAPGPSSNADLAERLRTLMAQPPNRRWRALGELVVTLDTAQTAANLEIARRILPREQYFQFRWQLVERWAENDPMAVLAWGEKLTSR